jgi:predicted esterase
MENEKYKILEYEEYAELIPIDGEYQYCMFFFSGFNEDSKKYTYQLKFFLESLSLVQIKVIIPFALKYKKEDYPTYWLNDSSRFTSFYAWYNFDVIINIDGSYGFSILNNAEKDEFITKLVLKEINLLGSSESIIFAGFSMGGRFLLHILSLLKIKTKFNLIFKTYFFGILNDVKDNPYDDFNNNIFFMYYSINDKLVTFNTAVTSIELMKKEFKSENVHVKIDNTKKHIFDTKSEMYLEQIFKKYLSPSFAKF